MKDYDTLSEAINGLKEEGFILDFNLLEDRLHCNELDKGFYAKQFNVIKFFRFEGNTNPDDSSILYAIETDSGEKGILLDAYGAYSGEISEEMIKALRMS